MSQSIAPTTPTVKTLSAQAGFAELNLRSLHPDFEISKTANKIAMMRFVDQNGRVIRVCATSSSKDLIVNAPGEAKKAFYSKNFQFCFPLDKETGAPILKFTLNNKNGDIITESEEITFG